MGAGAYGGLAGLAYLGPVLFNQLLSQVGQMAHWRKATACPCPDVRSGQAQAACPHCAGTGLVYADAVSGRVAVAGRTRGLLDTDGLSLCIPSDSPVYEMGGHDRVTLEGCRETFSQVLLAGANERLGFVPVRLDSVAWLDGAGNLVYGAVPNYQDGILVWGGTVPPAGVVYTLTGLRYVDYVCQSEPLLADGRLPRRVWLKRCGVSLRDRGQ